MNKIAIVIPYYKIDFFEETIASVAMQTDKRFTLYIGNDASPDDPLPIIEKYFIESDYRFFNYKENLGGQNLALQWERILENVEEEWFQILGDDDMIADNYVNSFYKQLDMLQEEIISVIRVNKITVDQDNIIIRKDFLDKKFILSTTLLEMGYLGETVTSLSEFIFSKKQYDQYKFENVPLAWGADVLAFVRFSNFGNIMLNNATFVSVKISPLSITGNTENLQKLKDEAFNIFRKILLNKYSKFFSISFINIVVKHYLHYCWKSHLKSELNLWDIYITRGRFLHFFKQRVTTYKVNHRQKH